MFWSLLPFGERRVSERRKGIGEQRVWTAYMSDIIGHRLILICLLGGGYPEMIIPNKVYEQNASTKSLKGGHSSRNPPANQYLIINL